MALFGKKQQSIIPTDAQPKTLDDLLAPSAISISSNYLQIGSQFARTLFVVTYPRYLNTNWFSPVINMGRPMDVSIFVHPQDTGNILKQLRDRLGRLEAQAMEEQAAGKVRDPVLETAINDIEALRDKLQQGTDRFFELGLYITIYGDSTKELDETESKIKTILDAQLVYSKQATFRMKEGFFSTMPLNDDQLVVHTSLNTEPISSIFPFVSYDLTADKGILYGINTHNNSLVLFDRFNLENANMVVFGKSGGGKSYAVKLEILRSLMFGTQVFVIDPENEYKFLSDTVGGTSIKISISSDQHINPFDLPAPLPDESPADVLRSHVLNLLGLFKIMLGALTPEEEAILDEAVNQTYALKDITPATTDLKSATPPLMSDLQSILEGMTGTESLAIRIKKYTEGSFAGFLNNPTNVQLDNQLITFSIRDMEEELRPIAMYLVLNFIWTQVRTELKRRILAVDEAWVLMKYEAGAAFLFNIAKRARKYFLGLTTISQDIPDFMTSPFGKPIVTNSSLQLLLKQSTASIELVKSTFNLTEAEKFFLMESRVGHGLFFAGTNHVALRVVASYAEDQIITSDPRQILEIEQAKKELAQQAS
jgi:type IV secretory pathway VirB4 component